MSGIYGPSPPPVQEGEDHVQGEMWEHSSPKGCSTKPLLQVSQSFWVPEDVVGETIQLTLRKQSWRGFWC